jgi:methylated-DNA-[protein]-cysteine S-methyltransferase
MSRVSFLLDELDTPTGRLLIVIDDADRLRAVDWQDHEHRLQRLLRLHYGHDVRLQPSPHASAASGALQAYFNGDLQAIAALEVATNGTGFQRDVWEALRRIPTGQTISYRSLAQEIGRPTATRAVGLANGSNPISIVVPCHRVIGTNGALTGYGGGIERKRWLLAHEGAGASAGTGGRMSESRPAQPQLFGPVFTKFPDSAD